MSDILTAIGVIVFALVAGWVARGREVARKRNAEKERNRRIREAAMREAEIQDDDALIDRITRSRGSK